MDKPKRTRLAEKSAAALGHTETRSAGGSERSRAGSVPKAAPSFAPEVPHAIDEIKERAPALDAPEHASSPASGATEAADASDTRKGAAPAARWRQWLAGSPREVLARIVQDDPLGVRDHVARRLKADAYLIDADRVHLRSLARCARHASRYHGRPELSVWLDGLVVDSIEDLLREDVEAERSGVAASLEHTAAFIALARPLGLEPETMRKACIGFNRLPAAERRAFFDLVIEGRSLDAIARASGESATEIARRARRALDAILSVQTRDIPAEDQP